MRFPKNIGDLCFRIKFFTDLVTKHKSAYYYNSYSASNITLSNSSDLVYSMDTVCFAIFVLKVVRTLQPFRAEFVKITKEQHVHMLMKVLP